MHNYATEMAMKHSSYRAGFFDLTEREIQSVPNWVATMNILFTLIAVGLLVTGLLVRLLLSPNIRLGVCRGIKHYASSSELVINQWHNWSHQIVGPGLRG